MEKPPIATDENMSYNPNAVKIRKKTKVWLCISQYQKVGELWYKFPDNKPCGFKNVIRHKTCGYCRSERIGEALEYLKGTTVGNL